MIFSLLLIAITVHWSDCLSWIQTANVFPSGGSSGMCVGYYNGSIWLIGGSGQSYREYVADEYLVRENEWKQHRYQPSTYYQNVDSGASQSWTQIDEIVWINGYESTDSYIMAFNMQTISLHRTTVLKRDTILVWSCITNINSHFLLVSGGYRKSYSSGGYTGFRDIFYIFDMTTWSWRDDGPSMTYPRSSHACSVDAATETLYVVGGWDGIYLDTVEMIDVSDMIQINNVQWNTLSDTLSVARCCLRCVVYHEFVYILGGWNGFKNIQTVELIDTTTHSITSGSNMKTAVNRHSQIIFPPTNTLYVFGGTDSNNALNIMQYAVLPTIPTPSPTQHPTANTVGPTSAPTQSPTSIPTPPPTQSPTSAPTDSPTPTPTQSPTSIPTPSPTQHPTKNTDGPTPSPTVPTKSPTSAPIPSPTISTISPISAPTQSPAFPTISPTSNPTRSPKLTTTTDVVSSEDVWSASSYLKNGSTLYYIVLIIGIMDVILIVFCLCYIVIKTRTRTRKRG
eukprot:739757_1